MLYGWQRLLPDQKNILSITGDIKTNRRDGNWFLKIVLLISLFIGAVTAVQLSYQFGDGLIPTYYIGYALRDMVIIELAPTITSLVLAGKIGSSIAAEIGGMRQKEIIDAMEIMGVNTEGYIVLPKILAGLFLLRF